MGFWKFPASSKLDVLEEDKYNHGDVIVAAMRDAETDVNRVDTNVYTLYGEEEALLVHPVSVSLRMALYVYWSVLSYLSSH